MGNASGAILLDQRTVVPEHLGLRGRKTVECRLATLPKIAQDGAKAWDNGIEIQGCNGSDESPDIAKQRAAWMKEQLLRRNVSSERVRIVADPCDKQLPHQHCAVARPIVVSPTKVGCP